MTTTIKVLCLAAFVSGIVSVMGQRPSTEHQLTWNTEDLPDGHIRVEVRNTSQVAVTAIVVEGQRCPIGSTNVHHSMRLFDSAINLYKDRPLKPGETHEFIMFGPNPPREQLRLRWVKVQAALFEDGGKWGDPEWTAVLTGDRSALYSFDSALVGVLRDANRQPSASTNIFPAIDELRQQYKQQAQSLHERIVIEAEANGIEEQIRQASQLPALQMPSLDLTTLKTVHSQLNPVIDQLSEKVRALQIATGQ